MSFFEGFTNITQGNKDVNTFICDNKETFSSFTGYGATGVCFAAAPNATVVQAFVSGGACGLLGDAVKNETSSALNSFCNSTSGNQK